MIELTKQEEKNLASLMFMGGKESVEWYEDVLKQKYGKMPKHNIIVVPYREEEHEIKNIKQEGDKKNGN